MKKIKFNFIFLFFCIWIFGCKDNTVDNLMHNEKILFQLDGVIENVGGDCAAVQIRTRSLGTIDLTGSNKVRFEFS
ncbi:MAG: hypothetical protein ABI792_06560, partial [bacterium]